MAKALFALILGAVCLLASGPALADWNPGDAYKMEVPMYPNEWGWNVLSTTGGLADDWRCSEDGPVSDIHFWGSWKNGQKGAILGFTVTIWSDVPVNPQDPTSYSHPGTVLWGPHYITEYQERYINPVPQAWEGWFDPANMDVLQNNHTDFYQYNLVNLPTPYFEQTAGEIYWLQIEANVSPETEPKFWGWKSSYQKFMDDAVFPDPTGLGWVEIYEPGQARQNGFNAQLDLQGMLLQSQSGGQFAYGDGWYLYEDDPSGIWWNIWFYDHPFRPERWKEVFVNGFVDVRSPLDGPGWIEIAINWSTPQWSLTGNPPGDPRRPPLPSDLPAPVGSYLQRHIILQGTTVPTGGLSLESLGFNIYDWGNPEWVSIDIRGSNIVINGMMQHACIGTEPASMDLSFIITTSGGAPTGACCDGQGQCFVTTKAACEAIAGNVYMGDNVPCLGDGNGNGQDDRCEMGLPQGACCVPSSGACYLTDAATCAANGDNYVGDGTACLGDLNGNGMDDACEPPPGACCLPDGQCIMTTAADCMSAVNNGDYLGDGTVCLGDGDGNNIDDACEGSDAKLKWFQEPDLSPGGMDVSAFRHPTYGPYLLASDFRCTQPGPITEIHVFGSWYLDKLPFNDPKNVSFTLSIHTDIPANEPGGPGYSMPGDVICLQQDVPFEVRMYAYGLEEGWLEPPDYWTPYPHGDAVCWEYIFYPTWNCIQEGTPAVPLVYWLDVQATALDDPGAFFGWKTAKPPEWNDDAVWAIGVDDWGAQINWQELTYPPGHPYYGLYESIDLAFAIYGVAEEPIGACCFDDGSCAAMTALACQQGGGTYGGDGTACAGTDINGNQVDDFCDGIVTLGACCYDDPTGAPQDLCVNTTQSLCGSHYTGTWYATQNCATFTCPLPTGACCFDDGSCQVMTEPACQQAGGTYGGDGTQCAGTDNNSNQVDDFCDGIVTLGACCYDDPTGGPNLCVNTTQSLCGSYYNGTWYATQDCATFTCPLPIGACCYGDDPNNLACIDVTQAICASQYNGTWYAGQDCATFECPSNPEKIKWRQIPDLTPEGLDIMATNQIVLADDFRCDEPGRITKVVVYGSWYHDAIPPDHNQVGFVLSFHRDIPAVVGQEFSRPGLLLCLQEFAPGDYQFEPLVQPGLIEEGWYDPRNPFYEFPGDHNVFKYTFVVTEPCWTQTGRNGEPKVYWLNVQARVATVTETYFGWKTSREHWNDDATWAIGVDPDLSPWQELRYPEMHPLFPQSIGLAFEIHGVLEDCCLIRVGDANGMGDYPEEVTLGDIMLMVDALFISGDCSKLPCLTEADVTQDGGLNPSCEDNITLGDIMRLVDFLFITGPELGHLNDCL